MIGDELSLLAEQVRQMETELERYRERDRTVVVALLRRIGQLEAEAAKSSPCKGHYLRKRVDDHNVFAMLLNTDPAQLLNL